MLSRRVYTSKIVVRWLVVVVLVITSLLLQGWTYAPATRAQTQMPDDLPDVLLLHYPDAGRPGEPTWTYSDHGFARIAQLYGLKVKSQSLLSFLLNDALLRDPNGDYYDLVFIDGRNLDAGLDGNEIETLKSAIAAGLNVLVTNFRVSNSPAMSALTSAEITGTVAVTDTSKNYTITLAAPEVTRQLSGIELHDKPGATYNPDDHAILVSEPATNTQVLAWAYDDSNTSYVVFARHNPGSGNLFVVSNENNASLRYGPLDYLYTSGLERNHGQFSQRWFSMLMPLMMVVRYASGDEAWHTDHQFANYTVDDPQLLQYENDFVANKGFNYTGILQEAIAHNFHFTLATIPARLHERQQEVVDLFLNNPERLSITQHGNNHDGYEFYQYVITTTDTPTYTARPLEVQEANIAEGYSRMQQFEQETGIHTTPVMVFPYNISPEATLVLLKQYNYQATINSLDYPIDRQRSTAVEAYMEPAEMEYGNFAVIRRHGNGQSPYPFQFFLGKPAWEYGHAYDLFGSGEITAYNRYADAINSVYGGNVEWRSIDYIMKHSYHQKINDDGSMDVKFWANDVIVTNNTSQERIFHIWREETENALIQRVMVDDMIVTPTLANGMLQVDVNLLSDASSNLRIIYGIHAPTYPFPFKLFMPFIQRGE